MKVVIQRVSEASVNIDGQLNAAIGKGLLLLLGYEAEDTPADIEWITNKIVNMRLFSDENGMMNLSLNDVKGEIMCISQFTLMAKTKKGNRPSFIKAADPKYANELYEETISRFKDKFQEKVKTGRFGADMKVHLINDGPVTILMDSKNKK